ncbi:hypothetical protein D3C80_1677990 [compost metagenome]
MAKGESFVEGLITGAKNLVSSGVGSISSAMTSVGSWVKSTTETDQETRDRLQAEEYKREFPGADPRLTDPATQYSMSDRSTFWLNWHKEQGNL